jgi:hypothetical protein
MFNEKKKTKKEMIKKSHCERVNFVFKNIKIITLFKKFEKTTK